MKRRISGPNSVSENTIQLLLLIVWKLSQSKEASGELCLVELCRFLDQHLNVFPPFLQQLWVVVVGWAGLGGNYNKGSLNYKKILGSKVTAHSHPELVVLSPPDNPAVFEVAFMKDLTFPLQFVSAFLSDDALWRERFMNLQMRSSLMLFAVLNKSQITTTWHIHLFQYRSKFNYKMSQFPCWLKQSLGFKSPNLLSASMLNTFWIFFSADCMWIWT